MWYNILGNILNNIKEKTMKSKTMVKIFSVLAIILFLSPLVYSAVSNVGYFIESTSAETSDTTSTDDTSTEK